MKQIILNSGETYNIILEGTTKEISDKVQELLKQNLDLYPEIEELPCKIESIEAIGLSMQVTETSLLKYISSKDDKGFNFYCYPKKSFSDGEVNVHDSATSSYYGALLMLSSPKYAIIYRKNKKIEYSDDTTDALGIALFAIKNEEKNATN